MKVGITTIEKMLSSGDERHYAIFLFLKSKFKKGCFYGYTHDRFVAESGMSKSSVRKYIKIFISRGWCHKHGENLMFKGLKHYKKIGFNKTFVLKSKTVKSIIKEFYYIILKIKQAQFDKLKSVGRAIKIAKSPKRLRRIDNFLEKFSLRKESLPSQNDALRMSTDKLGEVLKCSRSKANRIVNSLNRVKITKGKINKGFSKGGVIWRMECNKYQIA